MSELRNFTKIVKLRNGLWVTLRAIRPTDKDMLHKAFKELEPASVYSRFFGFKKDLSAQELEWATNVDFKSVVSLVVLTGSPPDQIIIGNGAYVRLDETSAEVAFVVEEDFQGLGIATMLLENLAAIARLQGLRRFEADVLSGNPAMLATFRRSGLAMRERLGDGIVHVTLDLHRPGQEMR